MMFWTCTVQDISQQAQKSIVEECTSHLLVRSRFKGQNWLQGHQNYVQAWEARERVEQDDGARCLVSEFREFLAWLHRSTRISVHQPLSSIPIDEEGSNDNDPYDLMTRTSMQPQQAPLENYMASQLGHLSNEAGERLVTSFGQRLKTELFNNFQILISNDILKH
ncbi:uncharacterized protein LOC110430692 [Sorghum bicolor]|uniref:Uncharacterized protein n=1 Tax=Sorghum bicolor TaxID=4558 RepID=A0A194YIW0_SORBI|nr:uncharacterized protein LOC110430692 [Sorghum bicolor]XP_021304181.1 uncharacterized protein LOC110430692 [Sorghum bicolor]XP_021304182.1 uncharacterized protein LOC110430692 [Sorghum bicolor]XP_021304183.1 uncharacterized protein LOC110430692 [Sorghum bicolor]KXG19909.1 hypothetical protein SORBI_3010G132900 [Sorghum bicolor]|eukprot:XP_021304180.1 uncharacterized protein LOC110430692 [Sorghum bicolor]